MEQEKKKENSVMLLLTNLDQKKKKVFRVRITSLGISLDPTNYNKLSLYFLTCRQSLWLLTSFEKQLISSLIVGVVLSIKCSEIFF